MGIRERRERGVARRHRGKPQPASGALWGLKRDVRSRGNYLMEHKKNGGETFRFDVRDFVYLQKQCTDPLPVYLIEYQGGEALYLIPAVLDETKRKVITKLYFSAKLDPVAHRNCKILFEKIGLTLSVLSRTEYKKVCEELDVRT